MFKKIQANSICIIILIIITLVMNLFTIITLNHFKKSIDNIDVSVECNHPDTNPITNIYYIQNEEEKENIEKDTILNEESNEEELDEKNSEDANIEIASVDEVLVNESNFSDEDFNTICRVVEAETHGADENSKIHIVHVILNRVSSSEFPNTIQGVCNQSGQFASRSDVEQSTIEAVNIALTVSDTTNGALFFCTCKGCWADNNKEYLFKDTIGHSFYK
jgi:hypothetical protein